MKTITNKCLFVLLLLVSVCRNSSAQNGLYFDASNNFLIPVLENEELKGHALVYFLDKVSKDSNSYALQVFDEYLHDVGEKKIMVPVDFKFQAAVYNGSHFITKFTNPKKGIKYLFFDRQANQLFDTLIECKLPREMEETEKNFSVAPLFVVKGQYVLDYQYVQEGRKTMMRVVRIGNDMKYGVEDRAVDGEKDHVQVLAADHQYIVEAAFHFYKHKKQQLFSTHIITRSSAGVLISEHSLQNDDTTVIFPIAAEIHPDGIEILSQFNRRSSAYATTKYGACIHYLYLNGQEKSPAFNEFTTTMVNDSAFKKNKLLIYSYQYLHKGVKLNNGNWLVVGEHLLRTRLKVNPFRNKNVVYNKKGIALFEIDKEAQIVRTHIEPNKKEGRRVPKAYHRNPHLGGLSMHRRGLLDVFYYLRDRSSMKDKISFIYRDIQAESNKVVLGNMLYDDGKITTDKFNLPKFKYYNLIAIGPARFGHIMLFKMNTYFGLFDIDQIKFNN